jgi:hypothetical protein
MSKTPAEVVKENFWVGAKGGLLDAKHILKMGQSVWLFLYLLRNQTSLNQAGEGVVNFGHPLTFEEIGADMKGINPITIKSWGIRLRRGGYIRTEQHGHGGMTFWISKGKSKTRKVKVTYEEARTMQEGAARLKASRHNNVRGESSNGHDNVRESLPSRHEYVPERVAEPPQPLAAVRVTGDFKTPTPKGFTPESPSYYNKDAAAKTAAAVSSLLRKVGRELQLPRQPHPSIEEQKHALRERGYLQ